jgi:opacity protein-like surface antigen
MRGLRGRLVTTAIALAAGVGPPSALAAEPEWHVGASVGSSNSDYNQRVINAGFLNQVTSAGGTIDFETSSVRRSAHAWWVDVGYFGSGDIGLDAIYLDLGTIRPRSGGTISGTNVDGAISIDSSVRSHGPALALTGITPLSEHFEVDARIGIYHGQTSINTTVTDVAGSSTAPLSAQSTGLLAGVGGSLSVDEHWSVRLDYLYVRKAGDKATTGSYNVSVATAGVSFAF